jgi:hypothetical protein
MAHAVLAPVIYTTPTAIHYPEVVFYCSDFCAKSDANYSGWYGAVELDQGDECPACGGWIDGIYDEEDPDFNEVYGE